MGPESPPDSGSAEGELFGDKNNSETIPEIGSETPVQADSDKIAKVGNVVGRQRRYEDPGPKKIPPVKQVFLFRYSTGYHWPGMSQDMQDWYEWYYFTKPIKSTERAKDAREYERHVKSWERGRRWIAEEYGIEALGDSRKIIAIRRREAR